MRCAFILITSWCRRVASANFLYHGPEQVLERGRRDLKDVGAIEWARLT